MANNLVRKYVSTNKRVDALRKELAEIEKALGEDRNSLMLVPLCCLDVRGLGALSDAGLHTIGDVMRCRIKDLCALLHPTRKHEALKRLERLRFALRVKFDVDLGRAVMAKSR